LHEEVGGDLGFKRTAMVRIPDRVTCQSFGNSPIGHDLNRTANVALILHGPTTS